LIHLLTGDLAMEKRPFDIDIAIERIEQAVARCLPA
jgi:hypothetical protein